MWLALSESTSASKGLTELVVCTENSNPDVMVVKPAEYRVRTNDSSLGHFQTSMRAAERSAARPISDFAIQTGQVRYVPYWKVIFCQLISRRQLIPFNCELTFAAAGPPLSATGAPPRFSNALDRNRVAMRP